MKAMTVTMKCTNKFSSRSAVTDSAMARAFVSDNPDTFRHSAALGWFRWTGRVWEPLTGDDAVIDQLRRYNKQILGVNAGCEASVYAALVKYLGTTFIRHQLVLARAMEPVRVDDPTAFDAEPDLLNCQNGVVHLPTGDLLDHDPERLMTKICSVGYHPEATHPDVVAMLGSMPDPAVREFMQRILGSACSGHTPADDVSIILDGSGNNGKSSVTVAAQSALGSYAAVVPDTVLGSNSDHPTGLSEFRGLRFALLEETPEDGRLNVQLLKKLSSGNEVRARRMRQDYFSFLPSHTLVVATNHKPIVTETDRGTWRRLALVPFPLSYGDQPGDLPLDRGLRERLRDSPDKQSEAMLAGMVAGAKRWYASDRALTPLPEPVAEATQAWRDESDVISMFSQDMLVWGPDESVTLPEMWQTFSVWSQGTGIIGYRSARSFNAALRAHEVGVKHGLKVTRSVGANWWLGVRVKTPEERF